MKRKCGTSIAFQFNSLQQKPSNVFPDQVENPINSPNEFDLSRSEIRTRVRRIPTLFIGKGCHGDNFIKHVAY